MTIVLTTKLIVGMIIGFIATMIVTFMFGVAFTLDYYKKKNEKLIREIEEEEMKAMDAKKSSKETEGRYSWGKSR